MPTSLTSFAFLMLLLQGGPCLSQDIYFAKYLSGFKRISIPHTITQKEIEKTAKRNDNYIDDLAISTFISAKPADTGNDARQHYVHHYYACLADNDSIKAVMYLKIAPVQGEYYLAEIALYNATTKKLLDRMTISEYSISAEKQEEFDNETIVNFSGAEIKKDLTILTSTGHFQMTSQGFKILAGRKEASTDW